MSTPDDLTAPQPIRPEGDRRAGRRVLVVEDGRVVVEVALHEHRARDRLSRSERWLTTVLRTIDDAVISTDAAGRIDGMNPAGERLIGWRVRGAVGRASGELLPLRALRDDAELQPIQRALRERRVVRIDAARLARGGEPAFVEGSAAPILDDAGGVSGVVLVLRDVTEQQRMRQQLELQDRLAALGTLAAGVAHEINNPLAWVLLNLELARDALAEHDAELAPAEWLDKVRAGLGDAQSGAERVRAIVADLRRLAAPPQAEHRAIDVVAALQWAVEVTRGEIARRARLALHLEELPPVDGDETRLGQVFVNLLLNAAHAIAPGRAGENTITIDARRGADGGVVVEVRDTGRGMSEELQRRIFEPYSTTTTTGEGSGLGLAIAHRIVTSLGGELAVDGRAGEGSVLRVVLPASTAAPAPAPRAPAAAEEPRAPRATILVIDDEPLLRSVIRRCLAGTGHEVVEAGGAREALALIAAGRRFDLLLCDMMMPGVGGIELHRELLEIAPDQARRMVFMTGGAAMAAVGDFLEEQASPWLEKPFDPATLEALIDRQLAALGVLAR